MHSRHLLLVASLALFAACKGSEGTGPNGLAGTMSFNFTGALSGTFNVTGQMPATQTQMETSSWAAGEVVTTGVDAGTFVAAATPRTASTHDLVFMQINRTNAGTATIDFDNCTANVCSTVFIFFGFQNGTGSGILQDCYLQTGTITITEVTATRVRGTFSGAGLCISSTQTQTAFTISNGTFDVALVPGVS